MSEATSGRGGASKRFAVQDFAALTDAFAEIQQLEAEPLTKLKRALAHFVAYSQAYLARYHLLFSAPELAAIVKGCQDAGKLPDMPNAELTDLICALVHGLIDLQAGGRMRREKGLTDASRGAELLGS